MARNINDKMFTREVVSTKVTAKVISVDAESVTIKEFNIPIETDSTDRAREFLKKYRETETELIVSVVSVEPVRKMYGMSLDDFIKYATELDPETRKPLNK